MKKLESAVFYDLTYIPPFVNKHHVQQEDIQQITPDKKGNAVLLYWKSDSAETAYPCPHLLTTR